MKIVSNSTYVQKSLFIFFLISFILGCFIVTKSSQAYVSEVSEDYPFQVAFEDANLIQMNQNKTQVDFYFSIPKDYYLYKESVLVEIDNEFVEANIVMPQGIMIEDKFKGGMTEVFYSELLVILKLKLLPGFNHNKQITGYIQYQGCSKRMCYRYMQTEFTFELDQNSINKENLILKQSPKPEKKSFLDYLKVNDFQDVLDQGLFFALIICFLAGLITAFTPCVLPIIPLTLAFIGVTEKENKLKRFYALIIFIMGMVVMYAGLGVLSAYLGLSLGFFYQSQLFLILLILFLLVMAGWLFGLFNIALPANWQNKIATYQPKGFLKHFYAGLTIGILAAPCVGPVLGPLLVYIAAKQSLSLGFFMMLSYALGLSILFFVLGFFSRSWVAKFGQKSEVLKKVIAFLLILTAIYFSYILIKPMLVVQKGYFYYDMIKAREVALNQNKDLLIDFYADWCPSCREWDHRVFINPNVKERILKDYVPVKVNCTIENRACVENAKRYHVVGMPTIIFANNMGIPYKNAKLAGVMMEAQDFIKYLDELENSK